MRPVTAPRRGTPPASRRTRPPVENAEIARLFREQADLLDIEGANPFRIRAYRTAARTVETQPAPVAQLALTDPERLRDLPGIGEDLAGKIGEIARTGRLAALDETSHRLPRGLTELLRVAPLGPRKTKLLFDRLGVRSRGDLARALRQGKLEGLPGFGPVTRARLERNLAAGRGDEARVPLATATQYGEALLAWLGQVPGIEQLTIAGSYRRCRDTVGDLDILVSTRTGQPVIDRFLHYPEREEILARGESRAALRLRSGLQVDLRVLAPECYGAGLYYFTGSKAHNIALRRLAQAHHLKLNEYGVWRGTRRIAGRTEREVARVLGLPLIPPELREDRGEIEAALAGGLPRLVERSEVRGDLQCHTTASDGRNSLREMAESAARLGYEYLALTDHTPAVRVAGGLDRAGFRRQRRAIDRWNAGGNGVTLLAGAEVDILKDGTLDLDDETLAGLDLVVISVHSALGLSRAEQTRRVLRALAHPAVDILGHPTARLLGRRPPIELDLEEVLSAAAGHGVIVEVNAQPDRLDLDETAIRLALAHDVKLAVSTDAHATAELEFMRWGIGQARRGWATREAVVNTRPLAALRPLFHRQRGSAR
jgi:DNA polymerase (family X)